MSAPTHHPHDDDIELHDATSGNGRPFRIGVSKTAQPSQTSSSVATHPTVVVYWPVENTKRETSADVKELGIDAYELDGPSGIIYDYRLNLLTSKYRKYVFTDETGDSYSLFVRHSVRQYIDYNSEGPAIVKVETFPL